MKTMLNAILLAACATVAQAVETTVVDANKEFGIMPRVAYDFVGKSGGSTDVVFADRSASINDVSVYYKGDKPGKVTFDVKGNPKDGFSTATGKGMTIGDKNGSGAASGGYVVFSPEK